MKKLLTSFFILLFLFCLPCLAHAERIEIVDYQGSKYIEFEDIQPYIDENARTMVPLQNCEKFLQGGVSYILDGNVITLVQAGFEYSTTLQLEIGSHTMLKNGESIELDSAPAIMDGTVYIPLRAVAEALEHGVFWDLDHYTVILGYNIAEIYIWNSEEAYSPGSLRYAIFQASQNDRPIDEIYSRAVSDFGEIEAQFEKIPSGDLTLYGLYRTKGYKMPDEEYRKIEDSIGLYFGHGCYLASRNIDEIPAIIKDATEYANEWFSEQLYALGESTLYDSSKQVYRFTFIPSFEKPFTVRAEIAPGNKSGKLYFSMCDGPISYYRGDLVKTEERELSQEEVESLLHILEKTDFWNIPTKDDRSGCDGSEWIFEGIKDGNYHMMYRWSPDDGPALELGLFFIDLYGGDVY